MRRRDFITLVGGAAAAWPLSARAQQPDRVRRIGVLSSATANNAMSQAEVMAFEQVLRTLGWRSGQNVRIEYRWGDSDPNLITANAAELAALMPDLIVANTTASFAAALKATRTLPVVFVNVSDPVAQGFVANLAHPGNNLTGFVAYEFSIATKWLDLIRQITPALSHVGVMFNPATSPQGKFFLEAIEAVGPGSGVEATALPVHEVSEIEPAIARLASRPNGGLIIGSENFLRLNGRIVAELAAHYRLPAVYGQTDFVQAGGLMSYTTDPVEPWRGAAYYVDRILKGANAGDLPIQLPSKFTLTINLKAVQALGLELPMGLMLSANEVIE
jgi:putative tryptophan/tyrosine transport system substrate-binding protein